uniref:Uncharacterized protein n=1 Tax=Cacopsylla melanoneura TaxID=428564 RepID=A0A8D8U0G2_9HEMI
MFHVLPLLFIPHCICVEWNNLDLDIPKDMDLNNYINYTTDCFDRNFSKYFHHNTLHLDTDKFTIDPSSSTLSLAAERPVLDNFCNKSQMGHCIFDDLFDMHTFRMKPEVEDKFLTQITDICMLRVDETNHLFSSGENPEHIKVKYVEIKNRCDKLIEEYSIKVLQTYKEQAKFAASHHYDLRPKDELRIKYEERMDSYFTRLGFEFLPIVEKHYQMCSDKYYSRFFVIPECDKNPMNEQERDQFKKKVDEVDIPQI